MILRQLFVWGVSLLLAGLAFAGDNQPSVPAPIQRLDIEQTPAGPVVLGLFGRFAPPGPPPMCGQCKCTGGTKYPGECDIDHITQLNPSCNNVYGCNWSDLVYQKDGCACLCLEVYPPDCYGCAVPGYCSSSKCATRRVP